MMDDGFYDGYDSSKEAPRRGMRFEGGEVLVNVEIVRGLGIVCTEVQKVAKKIIKILYSEVDNGENASYIIEIAIVTLKQCYSYD